jgi:hypothetical protein
VYELFWIGNNKLGAATHGRGIFTVPVSLCTNPLTVDKTVDDSTCGTLRTTLAYSSNGQTVIINLAAGSTIALSGTSGLDVPAGVNITTSPAAPCSPATGPAITISGANLTGSNLIGLQLHGGSTLNGLLITGFSGQKIKADTTGLLTTPNVLTCVQAK